MSVRSVGRRGTRAPTWGDRDPARAGDGAQTPRGTPRGLNPSRRSLRFSISSDRREGSRTDTWISAAEQRIHDPTAHPSWATVCMAPRSTRLFRRNSPRSYRCPVLRSRKRGDVYARPTPGVTSPSRGLPGSGDTCPQGHSWSDTLSASSICCFVTVGTIETVPRRGSNSTSPASSSDGTWMWYSWMR